MWVVSIAAVIALVVGAIIGWIIRGMRPRYRDEDVARLEAAAARNTGEVEALASERDDLRRRLDRLQASLSDGALAAGGAVATGAGAGLLASPTDPEASGGDEPGGDEADDDEAAGGGAERASAAEGTRAEDEAHEPRAVPDGAGADEAGDAAGAAAREHDERTDDDVWAPVERFIDGR